jgi:hypothetical protein
MEVWDFKMKNYQTYEFNSASQKIKDINNNEIVIKGRHELIKLKDSFIDKILGHSWYILDGKTIVNIGRGSYVENRCLQLKSCIGCKYLCYNNIGCPECFKNYEKICFKTNYSLKEYN